MTGEIRIATTTQEQADLCVHAYPDGTPLIYHSAGDYSVARLLVRPGSVTTLMTALWFVDAIVERGGKPPELILPLVPGSRQDRLTHEGDYLFTLKSVAREINLRRFPKVTVLDPHSDVTAALIERCEVITVADILRHHGRIDSYKFLTHFSLSQYDAVVSPDAGAEKRASAVAKLLGKPLLHGWKTRNVNTGAITGFGMEPRPAYWVSPSYAKQRPRQVLVVDDICDGGGTFAGLLRDTDLQHLTADGVVVDLWTTHGFYSKGTQLLHDAGYRNLYTTDSIVATNDGTNLNVCEHLLQKGHL